MLSEAVAATTTRMQQVSAAAGGDVVVRVDGSEVADVSVARLIGAPSARPGGGGAVDAR